MLFFNESPNPRRTHWVYDDPSGVPEGPISIDLPAPLRRPVMEAAAHAGLSPAEWLTRVVRSSLRPTTIRAI